MSTKTEECPRCIANGKDSRRDNLVVWQDTSAHCFSCGYHRFPKTYTIKEVKERVPKSLLPFDWTREVPAAAWKWLLQWGLPHSYWKESIGYSPSQQRLIFRVGDTHVTSDGLKRSNHPLAFSLGRFIPPEVRNTPLPDSNQSHPLRQGGGLPVQRAKASTKWLSYGDCHRHAEVISNPEADPSGPIVLVEDLISGHKVASGGFTSIPLFGTKVSPPVLYHLLQENRPVVLWLDKDQEGNVKREALHLQGILNQAIRVVVTDKDPKALSVETIKEII